MRSRRALTILEMLVSTAMLAFIVLGLTAMLIQTQKAFKTGIKQTTVTDAGRAVIDMIASDLTQLSDPHFTNVYNPYAAVNSLPPYPTYLYWQWVYFNDLNQSNYNDNNVLVPFRVNQLEDVFALVQTNNTWLGIGYCVSNWFTNSSGVPYPGVGTLYRYVTNTTAPLTNNMLFSNFQYSVANNFTNFHRVVDGVVHLKITAYDSDGNEDTNQLLSPNGPLQYPTILQFPTLPVATYQTNYLPHSIDIELGVLEPEAFEHARALFTSGATAAAEQYLTTCVGQVEIFRQHIIIPAAPSVLAATP